VKKLVGRVRGAAFPVGNRELNQETIPKRADAVALEIKIRQYAPFKLLETKERSI